MFIYIYIHTCIHTGSHVLTRMCVCVYVCACVYVCVCAYVWCVFVMFMYYKMSVGSSFKTNWKIHMQYMSAIYKHYQECSSQQTNKEELL